MLLLSNNLDIWVGWKILSNHHKQNKLYWRRLKTKEAFKLLLMTNLVNYQMYLELWPNIILIWRQLIQNLRNSSVEEEKWMLTSPLMEVLKMTMLLNVRKKFDKAKKSVYKNLLQRKYHGFPQKFKISTLLVNGFLLKEMVLRLLITQASLTWNTENAEKKLLK